MLELGLDGDVFALVGDAEVEVTSGFRHPSSTSSQEDRSKGLSHHEDARQADDAAEDGQEALMGEER